MVKVPLIDTVIHYRCHIDRYEDLKQYLKYHTDGRGYRRCFILSDIRKQFLEHNNILSGYTKKYLSILYQSGD